MWDGFGFLELSRRKRKYLPNEAPHRVSTWLNMRHLASSSDWGHSGHDVVFIILILQMRLFDCFSYLAFYWYFFSNKLVNLSDQAYLGHIRRISSLLQEHRVELESFPNRGIPRFGCPWLIVWSLEVHSWQIWQVSVRSRTVLNAICIFLSTSTPATWVNDRGDVHEWIIRREHGHISVSRKSSPDTLGIPASKIKKYIVNPIQLISVSPQCKMRPSLIFALFFFFLQRAIIKPNPLLVDDSGTRRT